MLAALAGCEDEDPLAGLDAGAPLEIAVQVSEASNLQTSESGQQATFKVVLTSRPSADVRLPVASTNVAEGVVSPEELRFGTGNWSTPQTVTITGVDDDVVDGNAVYSVVLGPVTSDDKNWDGVNGPAVSVTNLDDESAGLILSEPSNATREDGTEATFSVVLQSRPTADVSVEVASSDESEGVAAPSSLTFTPDNWNTPQTVTVTGVDDADVDGPVEYQVTVGPVTSSDEDYAALESREVTLQNEDDDSAGIVIIADDVLETTESGGKASFAIVLASRPTADVRLDVTSSNTNEGTVAPSSVVFTPDDWNTPQEVEVTGVDDDQPDGTQSYLVELSAAISDDDDYAGIDPPDIMVSNKDDDSPGFTLSELSAPSTSEAGASVTFELRLNARPSAVVSIGLSSSDESEGTVSPSSLSFDENNWQTPQTVTVTGVDDAVADGDQSFEIVTAAAVSDDEGYNGLDPDDVTVTNLDDDEVGIIVSPTTGLETNEGGGTATFTVALNSEPIADVTIGLSSSDESEGTVAPASLIFSAGNWSTPQTVTVTGVSDILDDGAVEYSVQLEAAVSEDPAYDGLDADDLVVTNRSLEWSVEVNTNIVAPRVFALADVNDDGRIDIVVGASSSENRYYTQDADGTFSLAQTLATTRESYGMALGDIDQDGDLDLATAGPNGAIDSPNSICANEEGTFSACLTAPQTGGPTFYGQHVALADVNGDGRADGVWGATNALVVGYTPFASALWDSFVTFPDPLVGEARALELADVDGDGDQDVVIARGSYSSMTYSGGFSIFLNDGAGSFGNRVELNAGSGDIFDFMNPFGAAVADFNGDGAPDIAFSNYSAGLYAIVIALRTSADNASPTYAFTSISVGAGGLYSNVRADDMNGDGNVDLVVGYGVSGHILLGDGEGGFTSYKSLGYTGFTLIADMNGDGGLDIVTASGTIKITYR